MERPCHPQQVIPVAGDQPSIDAGTRNRIEDAVVRGWIETPKVGLANVGKSTLFQEPLVKYIAIDSTGTAEGTLQEIGNVHGYCRGKASHPDPRRLARESHGLDHGVRRIKALDRFHGNESTPA